MHRGRRRNLAVTLIASALCWCGTWPSHAGAQPPCGCRAAGDAHITVNVPEAAKVLINGHPTSITGSRRRYLSLGLRPGYRYEYAIQAESQRGGSARRQTKVVRVQAGDRVEVSFEFGKAQPNTVAAAGVAPSPPPRTRLTLSVPDDAKVYMAGRELPGAGAVRTFSTARLRRGQPPAAYTVRVTIGRLGRTLSKEQTVAFAAGDSHQLTFDFGDLERQMLAGRDPRARQQAVRQEGGSRQTESGVAGGLSWIRQQQRADGSWTLHTPEYRGTHQGKPTRFSDVAATSLALLPFLGAGQTHASGQYTSEVAAGLSWLINRQKADGDLRGDLSLDKPTYAHGLASIVLCEACAMTGDRVLRDPAQKAIDFVVAAQHSGGGWRYAPGEAGDTSVLGWMMMALHSARLAGLNVPQSTFQKAGQFLDGVQSQGGSQYRYQPGRAPTHVMTAQGLLCRLYLGWQKDDPRVVQSVRYLLEQYPPQADDPNMYYWYYATQLFRHVGGDEWDTWNRQMREILVASQETTGQQAGSWTPRGGRALEGGRLYMTALATCTLEVYYRHAPIFREIRAE